VMPRSRQLTNLCQNTLQNAVRRGGRTTKKDLVGSAMNQISRSGGPARFGIGHAWMMMALGQIVMGEFTMLMKAPVSEAMTNVMRRKVPTTHAAMIEGATTWLAQEIGAGALHVFSLIATPDEWMKNAALKGDIANRVQREARRSEDIGRYLRDQGFNSLEDMLS
jgi:hypothetical protein